jgi:hypothetical protein
MSMKIRELLSNKGRWTQNYFAKDAEGKRTEVRSPTACAWCVAGAAWVCYGEEGSKIITQLETLAKKKYPGVADMSPLIHANDRLGYEAVMELVTTLDV